MNNVSFVIYADDNIPWVIENGVIQGTESLKKVSAELLCWFPNNQILTKVKSKSWQCRKLKI